MKLAPEKLRRWTPRLVGILFTGFLSVFAFDVLEEEESALQTVVALAIHLIPAATVAIALLVAWRWSRLGGLILLALGLGYLTMAWGRFPWSTSLLIAGSLFLLGLLFELDGWLTSRPRCPEGSRAPRP